MVEPIVKIIGKADLVCDKCKHAKFSVCGHPKWKEEGRLPPFIIAEQGTTVPPFCPLEKKG